MDLKRVFILTRYFMKNQIKGVVKYKEADKYKTTFIMLYMVVIILMASVFLSTLVNGHYKILKIDNEQFRLLEALFGINGMLLFIVSFIVMVVSIFNNSEIRNLIPLPLKIEEILISNFISSCIYQYSIVSIIVIPIFLYGIMDSRGYIFFIYSAISLALYPLAINCIVWILGIIFVDFGKRLAKDLNIKAILIASFFFILPFIQLVCMEDFNNSLMTNKFDTSNFNIVNNVLITNRIIIKILSCELKVSTIYLVVLVIITLILLCIFYFIGKKIYLTNSRDYDEGRQGQFIDKKIDIESYIGKNSIIISLLIEEFRSLIRTPAYLINCVIPAILFPIIWYIGINYGVITDPEFEGSLKGILNISQYSLILLVFIISIISAAINPIAYTSLAREGNNVYYKAALPIRFKYEFIVKYISSMSVNLITIIITAVLFCEIINYNIFVILGGILLSIVGVSFINITGILLDINTPGAHWSEKELYFKGNINALKIGVITIIIVGVTILFSMLTLQNIILCLGILTIVYVVLNYFAFNMMINSEII